MTVRDRLHAVVERVLPWYDPVAASLHDDRTEQIRIRSIRARQRAEGERERVAIAVRNTVDGVRDE